MSSLKTNAGQEVRKTIEFDSLPDSLISSANVETIDDKMVLELLGQLLITASQSHRTFLEQQEEFARDLMLRISDSPRVVESELLEAYQRIIASFSRLVEAIGDYPGS